MVPLIRCTSIAGIPLIQIINMGLITQKKVDEIVKRTRNGGKKIVDLLKSGSAYYAQAVKNEKVVTTTLKTAEQKMQLPILFQKYEKSKKR